MTLYTPLLIVWITVAAMFICTAHAEWTPPGDAGPAGPEPTISLDDPFSRSPEGGLVRPDTGAGKNPDGRISDPEPVIVPRIPDQVNNPQNPIFISEPSPVISNPAPGERISNPQKGYPDPCQNPGNPPIIHPAPTPVPRYCDPSPVIVNHPTGNIYPVYEKPEYRYRYISSSHRDDDDYYYSCSYHSSSWYRTGSLQIISTPDRAEVWLNNKYRGKTPHSGYLDISNLVPGTYDLLVRYDGYLPYTRTIYIERDEVQTMNVVLTRIEEYSVSLVKPVSTVSPASTLIISSEPAGATVLVDNEYRGITPVTLNNLVPGEHTLILQKPGYNDFVTKVQTVRDQTLPITAVMAQVPPQPTAPPVPVQTPVPVATRAGLPAGLVIVSLMTGFLAISRLQKREREN